MERKSTDTQMFDDNKVIPTEYLHIAPYPKGLTHEERYEIYMQSGPTGTFSLAGYNDQYDGNCHLMKEISTMINSAFSDEVDNAKATIIRFILLKERMYREGSHTENYEGLDFAIELLHFICTELVQRRQYNLLEDFVDVYYALGNITKNNVSGTCVNHHLVDIINQFDDAPEFCSIFEKFILNLSDDQYENLQIRDKKFTCYWKNFVIEARNMSDAAIDNKEN